MIAISGPFWGGGFTGVGTKKSDCISNFFRSQRRPMRPSPKRGRGKGRHSRGAGQWSRPTPANGFGLWGWPMGQANGAGKRVPAMALLRVLANFWPSPAPHAPAALLAPSLAMAAVDGEGRRCGWHAAAIGRAIPVTYSRLRRCPSKRASGALDGSTAPAPQWLEVSNIGKSAMAIADEGRCDQS